MTQPAERVDLAPHAGEKVRVLHVGGLERDRPARVVADRAIDDSHTAAAEQAGDLVRPDDGRFDHGLEGGGHGVSPRY
jgi:hypothetical protein